MHKNLIFDCGNVLHTWDPYYLAGCFTDNEEDRELFMNVLFPKWGIMDTGVSCEDFLDMILKEFPERLHESIKDIVYNWVYYFKPIPEMYDVIKRLKKNHKCYVLSNMPYRFLDVKDNDKIFSLFDGEVWSCNVGATKPGIEIYNYLLNTYKLDPKDCIFFDDMKENLDGATNAGIDTYQFDIKKFDEFIDYLKREENY